MAIPVADLYKHLTSIPAAFQATRQDPKDQGDLVRKLLKQLVEEHRVLQRHQGPGSFVRHGRSGPRFGNRPPSLRAGMTVIVANDTPPAIRGILKRWFVEPKPNVFVGEISPRPPPSDG